jgi:hypothetical protein
MNIARFFRPVFARLYGGCGRGHLRVCRFELSPVRQPCLVPATLPYHLARSLGVMSHVLLMEAS